MVQEFPTVSLDFTYITILLYISIAVSLTELGNY